jgi:hypothetical protein
MIRNPVTGRCVLRSGAIGQQLLGYTPTRKRSSSRSGYVRNPETGNMVLRSGRVGKQVLADRRQFFFLYLVAKQVSQKNGPSLLLFSPYVPSFFLCLFYFPCFIIPFMCLSLF